MYKDLREFIALVDKLGMLRRIIGADPRIEIGGITDVAAGLAECPAQLFDDRNKFPQVLIHATILCRCNQSPRYAPSR